MSFGRSLRGIVLAGLAASVVPTPARAQLTVRGYALGVGSYAGASDFLEAGANWFGRGRLMSDYASGPLSVEVAYEHVAQRQTEGGGFQITNAGGSRIDTDWLPLDWTIHDSDRGSWRHRFDRLALRLAEGPVEITVGRQAISWATTLFLTPADPFAPFDPSDPFREYRGGVDAARVRFFAGPFTEIEAVVRGADTPTGGKVSALARIATSKEGWAFGAWAGALHEEAAAALFATGALGATSLRTEVALREGADAGSIVRASLGFDRIFRPGGKDLTALVEIQYDGYGASAPDDLIATAQSAAYLRGDMQVLGRWTLATQASYQLHPLVGVDVLALSNLEDGSVLLGPGVSWSTTGSASTRAGLYLGAGAGATGPLALGSEYGSIPPIGYASLSIFF